MTLPLAPPLYEIDVGQRSDIQASPVAPPFTHPAVAVRPAIEELNGYRATGGLAQ